MSAKTYAFVFLYIIISVPVIGSFIIMYNFKRFKYSIDAVGMVFGFIVIGAFIFITTAMLLIYLGPKFIHISPQTVAVKDGKAHTIFTDETVVWADDPRIAGAHLERYHVINEQADVQFRFNGQHSVIYTGKFQIDYSYGGTPESYMAYANFIKNNTDITGLVNQFIIDGQATIKNPSDKDEIEAVKENLKKFLIAQLGDVKVNFTKISFSVSPF